MDRDDPLEQDRRNARALSPHLPEGYHAAFDGSTGTGPEQETVAAAVPRNSAGPASRGISRTNSTDNNKSSLLLQGGDIHRELFRVDQRANMIKRAQTFSVPESRGNGFIDDSVLTASEQQMPGGFRRQFLAQSRPNFLAARTPITRNFVEFLNLYGSFAGEDLAESDDEAIDDSESDQEDQRGQAGQDERRPLLSKTKSSKRQKQGDASTTKTFFTLLKAFIGTGIMFLPKAFNNGGILFSSLALAAISALSMLAFHLLLRCRTACGGGGYGDIGNAIAGPKMRTLVLGSITFSQLGFVCAGLVFVAQNLYTFSSSMTARRTGDVDATSPLSTTSLIALQLVVVIPLAFIRNISKLGPAALVADVFILAGVLYIYYYDIRSLAQYGPDPAVVLFNPDAFTLTIGSCIFTFEGIGLILPIQSSMSSPHHFEPLLGLVMSLITLLFCTVGALCYATFGPATKIEIIDNYPQTSPLVNAVQFLYSLAVLVGTPVQLFPAIRIIENKIFARSASGKRDTSIKWKKNAFRAFLASLCAAIAIGGASNLDRFVALIGSFACVPLVYIYPAFLHYKGVAETRTEKIADLAFVALGVVGMVYTTAVTVKSSFL